MKVASLISGIFYTISLVLLTIIYFILGLFISMAQEISSSSGGTVEGLPRIIYFMFAVIVATLVVVTLVACILVIKKTKASRIMFLISFSLCLLTVIVTTATVSVTEADLEFILGLFGLFAPVLLGGLATVFAFVAKNKVLPTQETRGDTTYESGE